MNDDKTKPSESSKPSHEAARVVIPFDIDMSAVETKLAEIERRVSNLRPGTTQDLQPKQVQIGNEKPSGSYQEEQQILKETQLIDIIARNQKEDESQKAAMLSSINRMNDLLRQINDVVLLMYSQMMTGRNNG